MPECLRIFDRESYKGNILMPGVDHHWLVQNFVRLLDSFLQGYWNEFIKNNMHTGEDGVVSKELLKVKTAYGVKLSQVLPDDDDDFEPMAVL